MFEKVLFLLCLSSALAQELCEPAPQLVECSLQSRLDTAEILTSYQHIQSSAMKIFVCYYASDGYKVRFSIRTALGSDAYVWNEDEKFLFRATLAYAMRKQKSELQFEVSNVIVCGETERVSFWFVVTSPLNATLLINKADVESAVRMSRHRINSAFLLADKTLEFLGISPTLEAPVEPATPPWLIVFGVVMGLVAAGIVALLASSLVQRKRRKNGARERDAQRHREENGTANQGVYNMSFSDNETVTQM